MIAADLPTAGLKKGFAAHDSRLTPQIARQMREPAGFQPGMQACCDGPTRSGAGAQRTVVLREKGASLMLILSIRNDGTFRSSARRQAQPDQDQEPAND